MTQHREAWLGGCPVTIAREEGEADRFVCLKCGMSTVDSVEAFLESRIENCKDRVKSAPPAPSEDEELPDGYTATHMSGGYFILTGPDGDEIPGPSNGKYQGLDAAVLAARARNQE